MNIVGMKRWRVSVHALAFTLVSTCAVSASAFGAAAPPSTSPNVWTYLNSLPADQRQAVMETNANREGHLVIYGALGIDRAELLIKPFEKKYPGIKVDFVRLQEPELLQRVVTEARARRVGSDLAISNVPWLDLLKPALGNYVPTSWNDYDPRFLYGGGDKGWTAVVYEVLPSAIAWRTDRIKSADAPKTLQALTDPKWKNRVGTTSQLEALMSGLTVAIGPAAADPLITKLAALNNHLYPSMAALSDGLAQGQIDLAWNIGADRPARLKKQGAPVDYVLQNPLLGLGITVSTVKGAKNPYAAALFMDYLTLPATLEYEDKAEAGLLFGNKKGKFTIELSSVPSLTLFPAISPDDFAKLSDKAESLFLRR